MVQWAFDPVRDSVAEQVEPLAAFEREIGARWSIRLDIARARSRIRSGLVAYDARELIASAGDLVGPFVRATVALERAGLATNRDAAAARARRDDVRTFVSAWLAGERLPGDGARAIGQRAAGLVASSILRRASSEICGGGELAPWRRATCPCCGGSPDLALNASRGRRLICSRCNATWRTEASGCIGCGASAEPTLGRIAAPAIGYEITICNSCGRYLKECSLGDAQVDPLVERMLTADLDAAAEHRGLMI